MPSTEPSKRSSISVKSMLLTAEDFVESDPDSERESGEDSTRVKEIKRGKGKNKAGVSPLLVGGTRFYTAGSNNRNVSKE